MDVSTVLAVLRRRWLVVLLLVAATGGAAAWVYGNVPVVYQSQASMIVLLPNENSDGSGATYPVNPYLNVGAASSQVAASALVTVSSSEEFLSALADQGVTSTTTAQVATYGGGVVLELTATNSSAAAAVADLPVVSAQISAELEQRQDAAGAPAGTLLTATDLTAPTPATPLTGDRTKLAAVTVLIGLLDTLAVVLVAEAVRRRRRTGPAPAGAGAEGSADVSAGPAAATPVEPPGSAAGASSAGSHRAGAEPDQDLGRDVGTGTAQPPRPAEEGVGAGRPFFGRSIGANGAGRR